MKIRVDKQLLFQILHSHSRLAQAEYERNPAYTCDHFSHKAEIATLGILGTDLLNEFFNYVEEHSEA